MTNEQLPSLRDLSAQDLAALGVEHVAYVRRIVMQDQVGWSIHLADGTQIAMADDRDVAFAAVRQHDLEPLSVH
jgi:hypothetical protein